MCFKFLYTFRYFWHFRINNIIFSAYQELTYSVSSTIKPQIDKKRLQSSWEKKLPSLCIRFINLKVSSLPVFGVKCDLTWNLSGFPVNNGCIISSWFRNPKCSENLKFSLIAKTWFELT